MTSSCFGVLDFADFLGFLRVYCADKNFMLQWECQRIWCPITAGLLVSVVGCVAVLVVTASGMVGVLVVLCDVVYF